jgi:hypothetical protein
MTTRVSGGYSVQLTPVPVRPPVITINGRKFEVQILQNGNALPPKEYDPGLLEGIGRAYSNMVKDLNPDARKSFSGKDIVVFSHNADHSVNGLTVHSLKDYQEGRGITRATTMVRADDLFADSVDTHIGTLQQIGRALRGDDYIPYEPVRREEDDFEDDDRGMPDATRQPLLERRRDASTVPTYGTDSRRVAMDDEDDLFDELDVRHDEARPLREAERRAPVTDEMPRTREGIELHQTSMRALQAIQGGADAREVVRRLQTDGRDDVNRVLFGAASQISTSNLSELARNPQAELLVRREVLALEPPQRDRERRTERADHEPVQMHPTPARREEEMRRILMSEDHVDSSRLPPPSSERDAYREIPDDSHRVERREDPHVRRHDEEEDFSADLELAPMSHDREMHRVDRHSSVVDPHQPRREDYEEF